MRWELEDRLSVGRGDENVLELPGDACITQ